MWFKYFLIAVIFIQILRSIMLIGKEQEKITPATAGVELLFDALLIAGVLKYFGG